MIPKLAWRNVWRNKRRSLITMASVFFAVFFAVAMRAAQFGTYDRMIDNVVTSFSGYIQIHKSGYWDDKVIDNAMEVDELPSSISERVEEVEGVSPRIESFALIATESKTKGALVLALDLAAEEAMLKLGDKLVEGRLFEAGNGEILVGQGLANSLAVGVGDTLVVLGQGYHGATAAGKYPVSGILKFPTPGMDSGLAFLPFATGQELFAAHGLATSLVVRLNDPRYLDPAFEQIKSLVDLDVYEVMRWQEVMPELVQTIQADSAGGVIMIAILYVVVSFGIFGTLLMMMNERLFEFGVLLSVGMSRAKLILTTLVELSILALLGAVAGAAVAYPLQIYFNRHPITLTGQAAEAIEQYGWEPVMPTSTDLTISLAHTVGVLLVTVLISTYAVITLMRLHPVEAMRS